MMVRQAEIGVNFGGAMECLEMRSADQIEDQDDDEDDYDMPGHATPSS
jgi:hypothetical protein